MQCNARNLVLLGRVDSGKSLLTELIVGGEGARRNNLCREVDIKLTPDEPATHVRLFEPAAINRNRVCLDIVREQTTDTCFVVVVDINKSVEFGNELTSLKELSEYLSEYSYSLFGNCMVVFTHIDELPAEVNRDRVAQQEFEEILSLADNRFIFLNCTDRSKENRDRALNEIVRLSKASLRIVCYGNTQFPSVWFQTIVDLPEFAAQINASGLQFHYHPDQSAYAIDIAREFYLSPQLIRIIGQTDSTGTGITVFVILITLTISYDTVYDALVNYFPTRNGLNANNEKCFWSRVVIVFHMNEGNYTSVIKQAIDNNTAIMNLLIRSGWRYTYMGKYRPNNIFVQEFISLCHRVRDENNNRQFIGGKNINQRAILDITTRRQEMTLKNQIFKFTRRHHKKLILAMILVSTPVMYRIVYAFVSYISKMFYSPIRQVLY